MDGNRSETSTTTHVAPDSRRGVRKRFRAGRTARLARFLVLLVMLGPFAVPGDVEGLLLDEQLQAATNAPADWPAGNTSVQAETTSNSIAIYTMLCPPGIDASGSSSFDQMMSACIARGMPPYPVSFSVDGAAFGSEAPDDRGIAIRRGLPAGTITAHIVSQYPYKTPVVFCQAQLNGAMDRPLTRYQVTEAWSVSIHDLLPGQDVGCFWFYIAPSPGYVSIHKFECPAGLDITSAGPNELKQACPPSRTPVEFILTHETAGISHEVTTAEYAEAMFRYVDAGRMTIREAVPPGFGVPIVYCETTLRTNEGTVTVRQYGRQIMTSVDSIESSIDTTGAAVTCDWFNVPGQLPSGSGEGPSRDVQVITPDEPATAPAPTGTAEPTSPLVEPTAPPIEVIPTVPGGNDVDPPGQNEQPPDPTPTPHIITKGRSAAPERTGL